MSRGALTAILAIVVASVWTATAVDAVAFDRGQPFDVSTTVMFVVVGFFMARKNGD